MVAMKTGSGWMIAQTTGKAGTGNWLAFKENFDRVWFSADQWRKAAAGIDKPWLCWNINDDWSVIQQKLVLAMGWTPIVGWDPNCPTSTRTIIPGAIEIDFNKYFGFPAMWPHFPLEFSFLWTDRLAFWHADLLLRLEKMRKVALLFESMKDGEMAAVESLGGWRNILKFCNHRYWELLGCTTKGASKNNFDTGCGWWRNFHLHPNTPDNEKGKRARYYYDSGVGIMYWKRHCHGKVHNIREKWINEGHCTQIGNPNYKNSEHKGEELDLNFDLRQVSANLGLESFL